MLCTSAASWSDQRSDCAKNHVNDISQFIENQYEKFGSVNPIGTLILSEYEDKLYIIDGQHRMKSYIICKKPEKIVVQIWKVNNKEEMEDLFMSINKNAPMSSYVTKNLEKNTKEGSKIPKDENKKTNKTKKERKKACDLLINYVEKNYPSYIKSTENPNFPNINIDQFQRIIHLLPNYSKFTTKNVVDYFEQFNTECKKELMMSRNAKDKKRLEAAQESEPNTGDVLYINRRIVKLKQDL